MDFWPWQWRYFVYWDVQVLKVKSNWQANSLLWFPGLPGFHIPIKLHCIRWPVIIRHTASSVPNTGTWRESFLMIPSNLSFTWLVQGGLTTGQAGPAHISTRGHVHMALPFHLNNIPVATEKGNAGTLLLRAGTPLEHTPPGQEILSCSLICPKCLKQYLAHSWWSVLACWMSKWRSHTFQALASLARQQHGTDTWNFLGQTKTCSSKPRCDHGCWAVGGTWAHAQGF